MSLDIWTREDIRNILLAANAATTEVVDQALEATPGASSSETIVAYRDGYQSALATLATAFGIATGRNGQLRTPGVVVPVSRLAVSYRAEKALGLLLETAERESS